MKGDRLINISERWFRLLLRLYPPDFRDDMGEGLVEAYRDRARDTLERRGPLALARLWVRAFVDSLRNGPGERTRPAVSWRRTGNWGRDAELATRRLLRAPAFVVTIVGTLTVGLGTFAVVYTVVQKILIERMPYKDPDDLYFVWRDYRAFFDLDRGWLGGPDVAELQKAGGVIEGAVGLLRQSATFSPEEGANPTEIGVMITSPNLFDVLGVHPVLGRGFAPGEVGPKRAAVIVLTHGLWSRFGSDPAIVGKTVRLNGQACTVVGVLPPHFTFVRNASLGPPQRADAYMTFDTNLAETNPNNGSYAGLIRVRKGSTPQQVAAVMTAAGQVIDSRDFKSRGLKLWAVGLKPDLVARVKPALLVLGAAGLFLVLVLMVNLASVLLARATQREHEFAVSRALGADGMAVVRAMVFEGVLLGLAGGVAAALVAIWGTRALVALAPLDLPRREMIVVDWGIGAVIVGVGVTLGLLASIAPAAWAAKSTLASLLASSAVRGGGGHGRMRRGMVVAQVALSLILLTTGGLVVRSFERLLRADPGFKPEGVLSMRVPIPSQFVQEPGQVVALQDRVERALAALPGVTGVSATSALPLTASANQNTVQIPGAPGNTGNKDQDAVLADYLGIRARYVEVMGMRVIAGRAFEEARREDVREALIDRRMAAQFFPTGTPLGARIPWGRDEQKRERFVTIVGVVDQARLYDVHEDGRPQVYLRAEDFGYRNLSFVMRTSRDPESLIPEARRMIRQIDGRIALADVKTMEQIVDDSLRQQRMSAVLIAGFAVGALILAAMGLFGIVSGFVTRRRHELAVRLALGADHQRLLRLVLSEGVLLVGIGVLIGLPGIYAAGRLVRGVLVGISPTDPATLATVAGGLAVVTLITCYVPARRVLRIEPAQLLRQE